MDFDFSSDGLWIVATGAGDTCRRWRFDGVTDGAMPRNTGLERTSVRHMMASADGEWLVTGGSAAPPQGETARTGMCFLTRVADRKTRPLATHRDSCSGVALSPDGRWIASTGLDGLVKVWDFSRVKQAFDGEGPLPSPRWELPMAETRLQYDRRLAFHPRGTLYAVCGDGILFAWDLAAADPATAVNEYRVHSIGYLLPDVVISPDGHWMAIARHGWDAAEPGESQAGNQVLVYDVSQPGDPQFRWALGSPALDRTMLAFSPDSRWLAVGGASTPPVVWDFAAENPADSPRFAPVNAQLLGSVQFSPDGKCLAIGGTDNLLYFWDWLNPGNLRTVDTGASVDSLAWLSPARIVTGGSAARLSFWDLDFPGLKSLARKTAGRSLTTSERERFRVSGQAGPETR